MDGIIVALIVGGVAGWLAGQIMKGGSQGLLMNILVGIIGGGVGNFLFGLLDVSVGAGIVGSIVTATVGAIILLFVVSKLSRS